MNTNVTVRSELKKIAANIETLAHEAYTGLSNGSSILDVANELVKSSITLTFHLGEMYGVEKDKGTNNATNTTAAAPKRKMHSNWHNVRDNRGRFVRAVRP